MFHGIKNISKNTEAIRVTFSVQLALKRIEQQKVAHLNRGRKFMISRGFFGPDLINSGSIVFREPPKQTSLDDNLVAQMLQQMFPKNVIGFRSEQKHGFQILLKTIHTFIEMKFREIIRENIKYIIRNTITPVKDKSLTEECILEFIRIVHLVLDSTGIRKTGDFILVDETEIISVPTSRIFRYIVDFKKYANHMVNCFEKVPIEKLCRPDFVVCVKFYFKEIIFSLRKHIESFDMRVKSVLDGNTEYVMKIAQCFAEFVTRIVTVEAPLEPCEFMAMLQSKTEIEQKRSVTEEMRGCLVKK